MRICDWSSTCALPICPTRVYCGPELDKLDVECRGFLLVLEQHGILDPAQRELVPDRAMALHQDDLDLDDLQWVVLMVLFYQPRSEAPYARMATPLIVHEPDPRPYCRTATRAGTDNLTPTGPPPPRP